MIVRACEPAYFGRVFSLTMLAFAGFGLMGLPIGLLADALGERGALRAMAAGVALVCAIAALRLRAIARSPGGPTPDERRSSRREGGRERG